MTPDNQSAHFGTQLEGLRALERSHGIVGIGVLTEPGPGEILGRDLVGHVTDVTKDAIRTLAERDSIPLAKDVCRVPPEARLPI